MGRRTIAALVVLSAAIAGREVAAEDGPAHAWHGRAMMTFNVGMHAAPGSFHYKDAYPILDGGATAEARFKGKVSSTYDIGGAVRLADNFGVGASLTRYSEELVVSSTLELPHPIFRNRMVSASLDGPGHREEGALHLYALYVLPMKGRVQLGLFAGPSHFDFAQELVRNFEGDVDFGADFDLELKLYEMVMKSVRGSTWGFNTGADLTCMLNDHAGIGALVRYSRASVKVENTLERTRTHEANTSLPLQLGGLTATAGLRLRF